MASDPLEEVRLPRIELTDLQKRLEASQAEAEALRREIDRNKEALQTVKLEAERHVSRARVQRDRARLDLSREVSRLVAAVAEAEAERDAALATVTAECDAAVKEANAQRDAAIARANAMESSGIWRLSRPARRLLEAFPVLHRTVRHTTRLVYRTATGQLRQEIMTRPVAEVRTTSVNASPNAATVIPEENIGKTVPDQTCEAAVGRFDRNPTDYGELFGGAYGLKATQLPEDARKCLIVPFEGVSLAARVPRLAVMVHAFYPERFKVVLKYIT